jgi:cysteine synthase
VAKQILDDAEEEGLLHPGTGSCIFEGTVGSTGISLATLARAKGYRCSIVIPDDIAEEKSDLLRKLGAEIDAVRPRGIVDPKHVSGSREVTLVLLLMFTLAVCQRSKAESGSIRRYRADRATCLRRRS